MLPLGISGSTHKGGVDALPETDGIDLLVVARRRRQQSWPFPMSKRSCTLSNLDGFGFVVCLSCAQSEFILK